ncbi:MAG: RimK family alpha-L-glutamate ligase [Saprospiraceae bacterium]
MNIGILSRSTQLYSTRSLYMAARARGHWVSVIDHTRCSLVVDADRPTVLYDGKPLPPLDAIIPRIGASVTGLGAAIIHQFDQMGVISPTSAAALQVARDKLRSLQLLAAHHLPVPRTIMVGEAMSLPPIVEMLGGYPVVVKVLESTHGEGVSLAGNLGELVQILNDHFYVYDRILLQEFIHEAEGADIRALVVDGKVVASMRRQALPGEFRSNLHRGASAVKVALKEEEQLLVERVVAVLGIEVAGVDLIPSQHGPLVMEVNASPGLEGIEGVTGVDVAGHIIRHLERKFKKNR